MQAYHYFLHEICLFVEKNQYLTKINRKLRKNAAVCSENEVIFLFLTNSYYISIILGIRIDINSKKKKH